jgi:uncharacterized membrane protein YfcA
MTASYICSGVLVGLLVGITGVGGGSLMTPLLVLLFGFNPVVAVGTDLLFASITKTVGVLVHHGSHRSVHWRIVGRLSLGSIPAACITLVLLRAYSATGADIAGPITVALSIALLLTAVAIVAKPHVRSFGERLPRQVVRWLGQNRKTITIVVGAVLGCLVTLSSVGAGALGTVSLLLLYPSLAAVSVVGTDLAYAIPLTAVAGCGHWLLGNVDISLLSALLLGSLPGIWLGSHISAKIPEYILRKLLACVLMAVAVVTIVKGCN